MINDGNNNPSNSRKYIRASYNSDFQIKAGRNVLLLRKWQQDRLDCHLNLTESHH